MPTVLTCGPEATEGFPDRRVPRERGCWNATAGGVNRLREIGGCVTRAVEHGAECECCNNLVGLLSVTRVAQAGNNDASDVRQICRTANRRREVLSRRALRCPRIEHPRANKFALF
jgi:hypothetical protein